MELNGYGQAVIHLAWIREDETLHLLFGMVELRPNELPPDPGCPVKSVRSGNKNCKYLYYQRFAASVADATEWYQRAISNNLALPDDPDHSRLADHASLQGGPFIQEPPWPDVVTSNDLHFSPDWMHGSRAHFLFPKTVLSPNFGQIIEADKVKRKLLEWLNFDIVDTYREYRGAITLVAPNPLFRSIGRSHLEPARPGFAESVAYKIVARQTQSLDGLRLEIVNQRPRGRLAPLVHDFGDDPIVIFDLPSEIYSEEMSITHPDHGLLSWHEPLPILRTIHTRMELPRRRKDVHVPGAGRRRSGYTYEVDEVDDGGEFVTGDPLLDADIVSRLSEAEGRRTRQKAARDQDQNWFDHAPADAAHFVRKKIGDARGRIFIVDPYFDYRGLLAFGHARRRPGVNLRVLTSARGLKESSADDPDTDSGSLLRRALEETFKILSTRPEIRVLSGKMPPVHDRFLVVDGNVWLSGNSFSTLGERAGMIVRLPDPEPVIARLEAFWRQAPNLPDWLSSRHAATDRN